MTNEYRNGFVFLIGEFPFLCKAWGNGLWLFYWHNNNSWVSHKPISINDADKLPRNLSQEEQDLYMKHSGLK